MASAAAVRLLRRLRAVPPALELRPSASSSSEFSAAAGLPGAPLAGLVSPRTAPFLLRRYTSRAPEDHGAKGSSETSGFGSLLERVNKLKKGKNSVLEQAINEQMKLKAEMNSFDKEVRHEMKDLAKTVDTLRKVGNITCVVIIGVPLLLVLGHHVLA